MIRNLLILFVFLGVGFGANVAQSDIFVRQSPKAESGDEAETPKKTNIFLRPFKKRGNKSEQIKNRLNTKLEISGLRRKTASDMRLLAYWQQRDREPETLEELRSYATALRSENVNRVLAKRNALIPTLEAARAENLTKFKARINAQAPNLQALQAVNEVILASSGMADVLRNPQAAVTKAVYQNYGAQAVERVQAASQERSREVQTLSTPKIAPIYRRPAASSDDSKDEPSSAAKGVYKNYR